MLWWLLLNQGEYKCECSACERARELDAERRASLRRQRFLERVDYRTDNFPRLLWANSVALDIASVFTVLYAVLRIVNAIELPSTVLDMCILLVVNTAIALSGYLISYGAGIEYYPNFPWCKKRFEFVKVLCLSLIAYMVLLFWHGGYPFLGYESTSSMVSEFVRSFNAD